MDKFWKTSNWIILFLQAVFIGLGVFYKHISFGAGLGDIILMFFVFLVFVFHLILSVRFLEKGWQKYRKLTIIFFFFLVLICLKATILRGSEYRWNGKIFYESKY